MIDNDKKKKNKINEWEWKNEKLLNDKMMIIWWYSDNMITMKGVEAITKQ